MLPPPFYSNNSRLSRLEANIEKLNLVVPLLVGAAILVFGFLWGSTASAAVVYDVTGTGSPGGSGGIWFKPSFDWSGSSAVDTVEYTYTNIGLAGSCHLVMDFGGVNSDGQDRYFNESETVALTFDWSSVAPVPAPGEGVYLTPEISGCGAGVSLFDRVVADQVADAESLTSGAGYDAIATVTTTAGPPAEYPTGYAVTLLQPASGADVPQNTINALGFDAYQFQVSTDVNMDDWPSLMPDWSVDLFLDDATVCRMVSAGGNTINGSTYGQTLNHKVDGDPDPCPTFGLNTYVALVGADFGGGFEYSATTAFTVTAFEPDNPYTCEESPEFLSPCWWGNIVAFLFKPSSGAVNGLAEAVDGLSVVWPFSWVSQAKDGFDGAFNQVQAEAAEPPAINPMLGEADISFFTYNLRRFYGDWAGPAAGLMIWLAVLVSIVAAIFKLLNVPFDPPEMPDIGDDEVMD